MLWKQALLLGRKKELLIFERKYNSPTSSLQFLFGKKYSGKTSLLNGFLKDKKSLYISQQEMMPLFLFSAIANKMYNFFSLNGLNVQYDNFKDILYLLSEQNIEKKLVIVIDDFQNILKADKNAFDDLIEIWKKKLKNKNIQLVISSSICFSALKNRKIEKISSNIIKLESLDYACVGRLFPKIEKMDEMFIYSLFGTEPAYLKYYNPEKDFIRNVYDLILSGDSRFFDNGMAILKEELHDVGTYASILYTISMGNVKIGDIAESLKVKSTYLTRYLQKLNDMMLIEKRLPLNDDVKKSKYGRYYIKSNFLRFWFCYVYPNNSALLNGKIMSVVKFIQKDFISRIVKESYKNYMKDMIAENAKQLFGYEPLKIESWWDNKGNDIDIVAYNRKQITFVQIFWEEMKVAQNHYTKLQSMAENFNTTLKRNYIIITKNTFLNTK